LIFFPSLPIILAIYFYSIFLPSDLSGLVIYGLIFVFVPAGFVYWVIGELPDIKREKREQEKTSDSKNQSATSEESNTDETKDQHAPSEKRDENQEISQA